MPTSIDELERWMLASEDEHIEFKEAKGQFDFDEAADYCVALANERGGKLVLGVTDKRPRRVVGSQAFGNRAKTARRLWDTLHLRIDVEEINHPDGRVVVLHVPPRPIGTALERGGRFLMRAGGSLVGMTSDQIRKIHQEAQPDFSAAICPGADMKSLLADAISVLRAAWRRKSGNPRIDELSDEQVLTDLGLVTADGVTYAALTLLGSEEALCQHLPQAEVIFEYRSDDTSIRHQERREFREGFLLFQDDLWDAVDARNDVEHYQDGPWLLDIPVFGEGVVRESILNAISHRDYRRQGPVFVKQFPRKLEVVSPGGFPEGVTEDNILYTQVARNRLLAGVLAACGFVERSGQGVDLMFRDSLREGKPRPDFIGTDEHQVQLTLHGEVQDPSFVRFLEDVAKERHVSFSTEDLIILDLLKRQEPVPERLRDRLTALVDAGVVERRGRKKHILSQRYYRFVDQTGRYTRLTGVGRKRSKLLLLTHIEQNQRDGSRMKDLMDVLPDHSRNQVKGLLKELRDEGLVHCRGVTRGARWYLGPRPRC